MTNNTNPPQNTTNYTWHLRHLSWPRINVLRVRIQVVGHLRITIRVVLSSFSAMAAHFLWVSISWLQPLEDPAYAVCKGCVPHGPGKPEPSAIKRDGEAYGGCRAASLTVLALSPTHFRRKKAGPQFISEYAGARRIHLAKRRLRSLAAFGGVFELRRPCGAEYDVTVQLFSHETISSVCVGPM